LESLYGVTEASCTRSRTVGGQTTYTVTFKDFPEIPYQVRPSDSLLEHTHKITNQTLVGRVAMVVVIL
jgi:hypothetical protein